MKTRLFISALIALFSVAVYPLTEQLAKGHSVRKQRQRDIRQRRRYRPASRLRNILFGIAERDGFWLVNAVKRPYNTLSPRPQQSG